MVDQAKNIPPSLQVVPGAAGVIFYKGFTQNLADIALCEGLGCTEFTIPFVSRHWIPGMAVAALLSAATAKEGYERWQQGDNYLETTGGLLALGSSGVMASSAITATLFGENPFPKFQQVKLWHVGQLAKGAKVMGGASGAFFVTSDIYQLMDDPSASRTEIGLGAAQATTDLAAIAVTFAPSIDVPVAGIVIFIILVGGSLYLGYLREEAKEQRILVDSALELFRKSPNMDAKTAMALNGELHRRLNSDGAHLMMEEIVNEREMETLKRIPPFIKRTLQSKLYEDVWFDGDARFYDALLEVHGASEGDPEKIANQVSRKMARLDLESRQTLEQFSKGVDH